MVDIPYQSMMHETNNVIWEDTMFLAAGVDFDQLNNTSECDLERDEKLVQNNS
jgi:hypothetical protein